MKRLKGPELKMSQLKAPQFLVDLYWDLRDRRLLPLVALGLVAIVAMPFLLGGDSQGPARIQGHAGPQATGSSASRFTVAVAKPGLRDYHDRLEHRTPTNPFKQRYTSAVLAGTELGNGEGEGESTVTTGGSSGEDSPSGGANGSPGTGAPGTLTRYTTAIDVKVTTTKTLSDGKKETSGPVLQKRVIPVAPLPNDKVQAVAYMGSSTDVKHPNNVILLVSDAVTAIFGEGNCLSGTEICQLLEVEPGMPETFVFGPESTRYKIVVLNPRPVPVGSYEP